MDSEAVLRRSPRLVAARALLDRGAVAQVGGGWTVRGSDLDYSVTAEAGLLRCTCRWEAEHHGSRGPCKHLLAVVLSRHDQLDGPRLNP